MHVETSELVNCRNVLNCVERDLQNPSRAEIAKHLGLSRTTASQNINKLISMGIVSELEKASSRGRGRPGLPLQLDESHWYALGGFFDDADWYFSVVTLKGTIIDKRHIPLKDLTVDSFIEALFEGVHYFLHKYSEKLLLALGLGCPGVIDREAGTIVKAVDLGWTDIPLKRIIQEKFGLPVYILNRYRTSGLASFLYGKGSGFQDVIFLGVGTGFGTAIFLGGKPMLSTNIHTGGIGHIIVDPNGPYCVCGRKGCLFPVGSSSALIKQVKAALQEQKTVSTLQDQVLSVETIMTAANKGDELARKCVRAVADPLCIAIGHLINIINPQRIILGGPMGYYGQYYCTYLEQQVVDTYHTPELSIVQTSMDNFGNAIGAASLVLENKLLLIPDSYCTA
ncbi:MAG: ROK family protein [Firmicutes bacterium]|nr:ROK family protein [Bacillota bacterium]